MWYSYIVHYISCTMVTMCIVLYKKLVHKKCNGAIVHLYIVRIYLSFYLDWRSASNSSFNSSILACNSLICRCNFATSPCSSSNRLPTPDISCSLRRILFSRSCFCFVSSSRFSWDNFSSPSIFRFCFSTSCLERFSRSKASSN